LEELGTDLKIGDHWKVKKFVHSLWNGLIRHSI